MSGKSILFSQFFYQNTKSKKRTIFGISCIFVCLLGMAPSFTQGDEWPSGSYGLPRPKSGCPGSKQNGWYEGWRFQDMENNEKNTSSRSRVSNGSHMDITLIGGGKDVNRTFCMKENTTRQTRIWPDGSYCIYKSGTCPKHMVGGGLVRWDDEDDENKNNKGGSLPDGVYDHNTIIYYCCQTRGHWYDSIELPVRQPFYLLTSSSTDSAKCQMVKWAFSYLEYIVFDTEDKTNGDSQKGDHVFIDNGRTVYYCYYKDCRRTMSGRSGSFTSHKAAVDEMDPRSQYCSWLITLAEPYIVSLSFKELNIPSCNDTFLRIYDGSNDTAPLLGTYCGSNATTHVMVLSSTNSLYIVSNSGSYSRSPKNVFNFHAQYTAENLTGDEWPSGSYGLPRPKSGCPDDKKNGWYEGWRFQDMENNEKNTSSRSRVSNGSHMDITLIGGGKDVNRTFCMKENTTRQTRIWPDGSYCIYKSGTCPKHMVDEGLVRWDDEDDENKNNKGGSLPDGVYDHNTIIYYCCQTRGHWYDSIELPVRQPFYLLTSNSINTPKCQMVKWAFSYLEYIVFDTEDKKNGDSQKGDHVFIDNGRTVYYCYYKDCRRTMNDTSGSFTSHKAAVDEMDPRSQYCSWLITLAEPYIVSLSFKELNIPSCNDTFLRIYDGSNDTAPLLGTYCGSNATTHVMVLSSTNSLYIVSNSGSYSRSPKNVFNFLAQYTAENLTEYQPTKPTSVDSNRSSVSIKVTTTSTISTTPAIKPSQTTCCSEEDTSSRIIIIIATAVGAGVLLCIVLIVLLVKCKRWKWSPELSTPVNITLTVKTPQESLPIDQEPFYETIPGVNQEFYDDIATNANESKESEDPSAEGGTSPSNAHNTSEYETPDQMQTGDTGSDYVIPAHEGRESNKDIDMQENEPSYTELDQSKHEAEDCPTYEKLVKT